MTAETITLGLFLIGLGLCIISGTEVLYALIFGMACFFFYSLKKGFTVRATCSMFLEGMSRVTNILIIFVFIGSLTAVWRICGTIPFILYHAMGLIEPVFCAVHLSALLHDVLSHRDLLWHSRTMGSDLYADLQHRRLKSAAHRRGCAVRHLFR